MLEILVYFSNDILDFQLFDFRCRYIVDEESQVADPVTRAVSLSLESHAMWGVPTTY